MTFTPEMLASVNSSSGGTAGAGAAPKFDPNATTMQTLPTAQPAQDQGGGYNPIKTFGDEMGSEFGGGENSVGSKLTQDVTQNEMTSDNPLTNLESLGKAEFRGLGDVAGAVFTPIGAALDAITGGKMSQGFKAVANASQNKGGIIDKITDNPVIQKLAMIDPQAGEDFQRLMNIIFLGSADAEKIPTGEIDANGNAVTEKPDVSTIVDRTKAQVEGPRR